MAGISATRRLCIMVPLVLILTSCNGGETIPIETGNVSPFAVNGTNTLFSAPNSSRTPVTPSMTPSITATGTQTLTPTRNPAGYELKDWREPLEVITPENMDRVEKIGELEFSDNVYRFAWSPDGSRFGVSLLGPLFVFDPLTLNIQWSLSGYMVAFSYDGLILENGGSQFDMVTGKQLGDVDNGSFIRYPGSIVDIEFSPDGKFIAAAGTEFAQIYPIKTGIEDGIFGRYVASAMHASVSPDSKTVAINYINEVFTELWDPFLRQPVKRLKLNDMNAQGKPRFSKDGKSLFFTGNGTWDGQEVTYFQEWNYQTGKH